MSFSREFFEKVELARQPVLALAATMDPRHSVRPWMLMLYQVIRSTRPLLEFALDVAPLSTFETSLHGYYAMKREEEGGHDVMILSGLLHAGFTKQDVQAAPLNPFVAEMCGRQWYLIRLAHPSAFLGYVGLLEGFVPSPLEVETLFRSSGLPTEVFEAARLHARVDALHKEELAEMLDAVPAPLRAGVLENGTRCAHLQHEALEHLSRNIRWDH